jgi:hypothetical protein
MLQFTENGTVAIELPAEIFADALRDAVVRAASLGLGGTQVLPPDPEFAAPVKQRVAGCGDVPTPACPPRDADHKDAGERDGADQEVGAAKDRRRPCIDAGCAAGRACGCGPETTVDELVSKSVEGGLFGAGVPAEPPDVLADGGEVEAFNLSGRGSKRIVGVDEEALVANHLERAKLAEEYQRLRAAIEHGTAPPGVEERLGDLAEKCGLKRTLAEDEAAARMRELARCEDTGLQVATETRGGYPWTAKPETYGNVPHHAEDGGP